MSCQHGNWPPCDHCDEIDAAVAHATAARDAEIEALRAEVERWKSLHATAYDAFRTGVATERRLEARAERLAEALREAYRQVRELCDCYGHVYPEASFVRYEALLREQEEGK